MRLRNTCASAALLLPLRNTSRPSTLVDAMGGACMAGSQQAARWRGGISTGPKQWPAQRLGACARTCTITPSLAIKSSVWGAPPLYFFHCAEQARRRGAWAGARAAPGRACGCAWGRGWATHAWISTARAHPGRQAGRAQRSAARVQRTHACTWNPTPPSARTVNPAVAARPHARTPHQALPRAARAPWSAARAAWQQWGARGQPWAPPGRLGRSQATPASSCACACLLCGGRKGIGEFFPHHGSMTSCGPELFAAAVVCSQPPSVAGSRCCCGGMAVRAPLGACRLR